MFLYRLSFDSDLSTVKGGDYDSHFEQLVFCCTLVGACVMRYVMLSAQTQREVT